MGNLIYQNWLVELTRPAGDETAGMLWAAGPNPRVCRAVRTALERLDEDERRFIEWVYFMGRTYRELSELTGRPVHRLEAVRRRAFRKLRTLLTSFVASEYGLRVKPASRCAICSSAEREAIEAIIRARDRTATWRPVLREIRDRCRTPIRSPQILITHETYHMVRAVKDDSRSDRSGHEIPTDREGEAYHVR